MSDKTDAELIADNRKDAEAWLEGRRAIDCSNPQGRLILYSMELANRLEARNAEIAELKRLIEWLSERGVSPQGGICTRIRLLDYLKDGPEKQAIEKIVGEK